MSLVGRKSLFGLFRVSLMNKTLLLCISFALPKVLQYRFLFGRNKFCLRIALGKIFVLQTIA